MVFREAYAVNKGSRTRGKAFPAEEPSGWIVAVYIATCPEVVIYN
jgi:hypothetical protein